MIGCGGAFGQCSRSGVEIAANLRLSTCAGANGDRAAGRTAGHCWSQEEEEGNTQDILVLAWRRRRRRRRRRATLSRTSWFYLAWTPLAKFEDILNISTAEVLPL